MDEQRSSIDDFLDEIVSPETGVTRAEANRDFTEFTFTIDRAGASQEAMAALGWLDFSLAIITGMYQIFDGVAPDATRLRVEYVDAATGETYQVYDSREG